LRSGRRAFSPPGLAVLGGVLVALVFFTASRVRLSAAAAMVPFAAAGIVCAARRLRAGQARTVAVPLAAAAAAGLLAAAPWWPRPLLVRPLDYRTGTDLALRALRARAAAGPIRPGRARAGRKQLATEPGPLRGLRRERSPP
jgi:hypothetical protein